VKHVQTRILCPAQDFATFARVSGYVEQFDIHSPQATVKEALWFSARLRLTNDISNKELWAFIRQVRPPIKLRLSCIIGLCLTLCAGPLTLHCFRTG